jgi:hypothetical protein
MEKLLGKRQLEGPRRRWYYSIKIDLREVADEDAR